MSYSPDDLAPLLAEQPTPGVGYRQGVILSWNRATAENTVQVDGAVLANLPILNTNEASQLSAGDVVGILTAGPAWFILGRITVPGTPAAASALAAVFNQIVAARDNAAGTRTSTSYGDLTGANPGPSVTVNISNSGRALVLWSVDCDSSVDWRPTLTGGTSVAVSGATTIAASAEYSLGPFIQHPASPNPGNALVAGGFQGAMMHLFTNLNPGQNTFTLKYRNRAAADGPVSFSAREIAVFAM